MKAELAEYDGCFSLDCTAETMAEAAALTRWGLLGKTRPQVFISVTANNAFELSVVAQKNKNASNSFRK